MIDAARREARELDHGWIGVEHLLLALTRGDSIASRALDAAGATSAAVQRSLAAVKPDPDLAPPPRWHESAKPTPRLQRISDGIGDGSAEDWLTAILCEPVSLAASALDEVAGGREGVGRELRKLGVDPGDLPPNPPWLPHGDSIYVPGDRLMDVVRVASREVGVGFAFNTTRDGRGRVSAPRGVDLQAIVDRVLADA